METPGIDLTIVDLHGSVDEAAARIDDACRSVGFFRVPLSVVPAEIADPAWDAARRFFALPDGEKREVAFPEPGYPYGWSPMRFESLSASLGEAGGGDLKESFSVGPDCLGPPPLPAEPGEAWIRSPSLWPTAPPDLRGAFEAYFRAQSDIAARILSLMAVALDLPSDHFESLIDRHTSALRALHYPPLDGASAGEPGTLRASAHSDYGTLTILRTDAVGGLEIRGTDGEWFAVEPRADSYVVNLGDSIAQWTNDRWRSTVHRVSPTDPARRHSMAFFHMANWDATIECLPTCLPAGEAPRHAPVKAGPWLMRKFRSTVT